MRRSTMLVMAIMLVAFGAMFAAAGSALRPLAEDAEAAKFLTRMLEARGDLAPGSQVRLSRLKASEQRLAEEGRGLVVRIRPSMTVRSRSGGLRGLAIRAAHEALSQYPGARNDWVEIVLDVGEPGGAEKAVRTLLSMREGSLSLQPTPPLPPRLPATR